jgi:predicted nucleic acid-binding protein
MVTDLPLVDSCVLVALANEDDSLHARARSLDLGGGVVTQMVLCEVANVLQKRVGDKKAVVRALKYLLERVPVAALSEGDLWNALALFANNYPRLSFTDASLLALSRRTGDKIISFDEQFSKAAGENGR